MEGGAAARSGDGCSSASNRFTDYKHARPHTKHTHTIDQTASAQCTDEEVSLASHRGKRTKVVRVSFNQRKRKTRAAKCTPSAVSRAAAPPPLPHPPYHLHPIASITPFLSASLFFFFWCVSGQACVCSATHPPPTRLGSHPRPRTHTRWPPPLPMVASPSSCSRAPAHPPSSAGKVRHTPAGLRALQRRAQQNLVREREWEGDDIRASRSRKKRWGMDMRT